jgi:hypothetical protein
LHRQLLIHGDHRGRGSLVYLWNPATMSCPDRPRRTSSAAATVAARRAGVVVGGHVDVHVGIKECFIFDPASETWTQAASLNAARWYPTCTALPGGRVLAVAGSDATMGGTRIPELYPPSAPGSPTWDQLPTAEKQLGVDPYYPFMFVLGSGKVFYGGPDHIGTDPPHAVLVTDTGTWADLATPVPVLNLGEENVPAVTWLGADGSQTVQVSGGRYSATSLWAQPYAWLIKFDAAGTMLSPGWRPTIQSMTYARVNHNATLLADGTVFISGGGGYSNNKNAAVKAGELFDPLTETWTVLAQRQKPRLHHSTAFLLPDGRVG